MRRLPPSNQPEEKSLFARHAPKVLGLIIGLVVGYLLFPGSSNEPTAALPSNKALAATH